MEKVAVSVMALLIGLAVGTLAIWYVSGHKNPLMSDIVRYRWKGQIYCESCGSTLKRVDYRSSAKTDVYDPFTGQRRTAAKVPGLMVCSNPSQSYTEWNFWFHHRDSSYSSGKHSMYYTDKPPLS